MRISYLFGFYKMDNFNAFASWVVFSIHIPFRVVRITTALHARSTHVTWPIGDVISVDTSVIKPAALWPRFSIIDVQIFKYRAKMFKRRLTLIQETRKVV